MEMSHCNKLKIHEKHRDISTLLEHYNGIITLGTCWKFGVGDRSLNLMFELIFMMKADLL